MLDERRYTARIHYIKVQKQANLSNIVIKNIVIGCKTTKKSKGMIITKVRKVITSREREEEAIEEGHMGDF